MMSSEYNIIIKFTADLKKPDIVKLIKASHIGWPGHLFRYDDTNPTNLVTSSKIQGTRKRRPPPGGLILLRELSGSGSQLLAIYRSKQNQKEKAHRDRFGM
ncbi:hypothetical protein TNCV_4295091 [Trichonephila clavipes]|uniref:Uncharacterized protein n=1 Tax=Trichonephila clavipes TaxID=2585209 RepID=A0A8X6V0B3_TRICX|nr:hypothetical protein TNCV_4295091 [Trichonephila clavipes]